MDPKLRDFRVNNIKNLFSRWDVEKTNLVAAFGASY